MKTTISILFLFLLTLSVSHAQRVRPQWAKSIGSVYSDAGWSNAVDIAGNVYVTGFFSAPFTLDTGSRAITLPNKNYRSDVFISKYDKNGTINWIKSFGDSLDESGKKIVVDGSGNIYVAGLYQGTVDFDPGVKKVELKAKSSTGAFLVKYDSSGNFIWANDIPIPEPNSGYTSTIALTIDHSNDIYISTTLGISKMDTNGKQLWNTKIIGNDHLFVYSCTTDADKNLYLTGEYNGFIDFDPTIEHDNLQGKIGSYDGFILKLDSSGTFRWVKSITTTTQYIRSSPTTSIVYDGKGYLYITGYFQERIVFDVLSPSLNFLTLGNSDMYIAKLDTVGTYIWTKQIGGNYSDIATDITLDAEGMLYVTGSFTGSVDFDPGPEIHPIITNFNSGSNRIFVSKYDTAGRYMWAEYIGVSEDGRATGRSITISKSGEIILTGEFSDICDFDPGIGTSYLSSAGYTDCYVVKLRQITTGVPEPFNNTAVLYPNPTTGACTLEFGTSISNGRLRLINLLGQPIIERDELSGEACIIDLTGQASGMYLVEISSGGDVMRKNLVKE